MVDERELIIGLYLLPSTEVDGGTGGTPPALDIAQRTFHDSLRVIMRLPQSEAGAAIGMAAAVLKHFDQTLDSDSTNNILNIGESPFDEVFPPESREGIERFHANMGLSGIEFNEEEFWKPINSNMLVLLYGVMQYLRQYQEDVDGSGPPFLEAKGREFAKFERKVNKISAEQAAAEITQFLLNEPGALDSMRWIFYTAADILSPSAENYQSEKAASIHYREEEHKLNQMEVKTWIEGKAKGQNLDLYSEGNRVLIGRGKMRAMANEVLKELRPLLKDELYERFLARLSIPQGEDNDELPLGILNASFPPDADVYDEDIIPIRNAFFDHIATFLLISYSLNAEQKEYARQYDEIRKQEAQALQAMRESQQGQ